VGEDNDTVQQWNQLCQLLQAGVRGVESVTGVEDRPKVLLHTTTAGWYRGTEKWFGHMERNGVNYDMIAWSYYPEHHGSLQKLQENISLTVQRFKKPVVIVESSYPASDRSLLEEGVRDIKSVMAYPMSESGQKEFLEELISICKGAPHQLGKGVFWWFPEALQPPTKAILKKSGIKLGFSGWKNGADALFTWCDPVVPFELRAKPRAALEAFRASGWR
jgi:arabinogalactan endo-1,4-beta-galactosidase